MKINKVLKKKLSEITKCFHLALTMCLAAMHPMLNAQGVSSFQSAVPSSPEATGLGKFADVPVSFYTGLPQIDVPIYTLSDPEISVPISLSYHSNGIRVSEEASQVGLGWNLNAGGMITRVVRGGNDWDHGYTCSHDIPYMDGYQDIPDIPDNYYSIEYDDYSSIVHFDCIPQPDDITTCDFGGETYDLTEFCDHDFEPDLYTFNINGSSGKFIFDREAGKFITLDNRNVVNISADANGLSWSVTTNDGFTYYFGSTDNSRQYTHLDKDTYVYSGSQNDGELPETCDPEQYISTWFLDRIESPNGQTVNLNYTKDGIVRPLPGFSEMESHPLAVDAIATCQNGAGFPSMAVVRTILVDHIEYDRITLDEIVGSFMTVKFDYSSTTRMDLQGGRQLENIKVVNGGNIIYDYRMLYGYFESVTSSTDHLWNEDSEVNFTFGQNVLNKRLKLKSVEQIATDGQVLPIATFTYDESTGLPPKTSYSIDHWGYGRDHTSSSTNDTYIPAWEGVDFNDDLHQFPGADRSSDPDIMKAWLLTGIQYPTGGVAIFEYEPNSFCNIPESYVITGDESHHLEHYCDCPTGDPNIYQAGFTVPQEIPHGQIPARFKLEWTLTNGNCGYTNTAHIDPNNWETSPNGFKVTLNKVGHTGPYKTWHFNQSIEGHNYICCTDIGGATQYILEDTDFTLIPGEYEIILERLIPGQVWPDNLTCANAEISFDQYEIVDCEVGAGMRLKSMTNVAGLFTEFEYLDEDDQSSGLIINNPLYERLTYKGSGAQNQPGCLYSEYLLQVLERNSSSLNGLSNAMAGNFVGYSTVTQYLGEENEFGKSVYEYMNEPTSARTYELPGSIPRFYNLSNGNLLKEKHYKILDGTSFELVEETINNYEFDVDFFNRIWSMFVEIVISQSGGSSDPCVDPQYYGRRIYYYATIPQWHKLTNSETTTYFPEGNVVTGSSNTYYDNNFMVQTSNTYGPGVNLTTEVKYADQLANALLLGKNMTGIPLESKVNSGSGGGSKVVYADWNGEVRPQLYQSWNSFHNQWQTEVTIDQYNALGLPTQISKRGYDNPEHYAWTEDRMTERNWGSWTWNYDYYFDENRKMKQFTDKDLQVVDFTYDGFQRLEEQNQREGAITTTYDYHFAVVHGKNSMLKQVDLSDDDYYAFDTEQYFDGLGRPTVLTKLGYTASHANWNEGVGYDEMGRVEIRSNPAEGSYYQYTFEPSPIERMLTEKQGNWPKSVMYTYGSENGYFKTIRKDEDERETKTLADALGRTIAQTDGLGNVTTYTYDDRGNVDVVSGPAGDYDYTYDGRGRLKTKTVPDGGLHKYNYYDNDLLKRTTDPLNQKLVNIYNDYGQLEKVRKDGLNGPIVKEYTYYPTGPGKTGQIQTEELQVDQGGATFRDYTYDEFGRVTRRNVSSPGGSATFDYLEMDHADLVGRMRRTLPGHGHVVYKNEFDHGGRVVKEYVGIEGFVFSEPPLVSQYVYNDNDWRILHKMGDNMQYPLQNVDYGYNERGWITNINSIDEILDDVEGFVGPDLPPLGEDDLYDIIFTLITEYDRQDIADCIATNYRISINGNVTVHTGAYAGTYPFSRRYSLPVNGGDPAKVNYSDGDTYQIYGAADLDLVIEEMSKDLDGDLYTLANYSASTQCDFIARGQFGSLLPGYFFLNEVRFNGVNILEQNYNLNSSSDINLAEQHMNSWLSDHGGGTAKIETEVIGNYSHYRIKLLDASNINSYSRFGVEYNFDNGLEERSHHFTADNETSCECQIEGDYTLNIERPESFTPCFADDFKLIELWAGEENLIPPGVEYTMNNSLHQYSLRSRIIDWLNDGHAYDDVFVSETEIKITRTDAAFDRALFICGNGQTVEPSFGRERSCPDCYLTPYYFTELLHEWLNIIFGDDYHDLLVEPKEDPCDLFAEEIIYEDPVDPDLNANPQFSGNISYNKWINAYSPEIHAYVYTYDDADRLEKANYASRTPVNGQFNFSGNYNVDLSYDAAGNILSIKRNGAIDLQNQVLIFDKMDDLTMNYQGNRLMSVAENPANQYTENGFLTAGGEMTYDANGNMLTNDFKEITSIKYDYFNMPTEIDVKNSHISNFYDADGTKTKMVAGDKTNFYLEGVVYSSETEGYEIYYNGGRLAWDKNDEKFYYEYHIDDHLGNGRLWFSDRNGDGVIDCQDPNSGEILQVKDYYPFGMEHKIGWQVPLTDRKNNYTYNGKEHEGDLTSYLDYGARWYDPSIGRFMKHDRFADNFPEQSPYLYASNNPIIFIDMNGDSSWPVIREWTQQDFKNYQSFVSDEVEEIQDNEERFDCADLACSLLIRFASENGLEIEFTAADGSTLNSSSDVADSPEGFEQVVNSKVNAESLKNDLVIINGDAVAGDMTNDGVHVNVVIEGASHGKSTVTTTSGTLPPRVPDNARIMRTRSFKRFKALNNVANKVIPFHSSLQGN